MQWSAKPSQINDSFGTWADDLAAHTSVQLEPRKIIEQPFQGTIARTEAGPIRISRVTATKHRILRLRSHIARGKDDLCFINLQLEGVARYTQRDHEQINGPADLAIVDTAEPFEIVNAHDFKVLCIAVPRQLLPAGFCERPRFTLSATEAGRALSSDAWRLCRALLQLTDNSGNCRPWWGAHCRSDFSRTRRTCGRIFGSGERPCVVDDDAGSYRSSLQRPRSFC
jgi:AraC-binding-like domain